MDGCPQADPVSPLDDYALEDGYTPAPRAG